MLHGASFSSSAHERCVNRLELEGLPSITSLVQKWGGSRGMGMHYKCIKAVEQKAYCLFIYLIGSNYASMYPEERQPKPVVICSDSCGRNLGADDPLAKAANESN